MMQLRTYFLLVMALCLVACSNQPVSKWYESSSQQKVEAVQHWGVIADDAATQTRLALNASQLASNRPVFVQEGSNSHFDRAFRNYMITSLVNAGVPVSTVKDSAVEVSYQTQVIRHGESFDPSLFGYKPGVATIGTAGFWVLRNASTSGLAAGTIASAIGYDGYSAVKPTGVELIITTSITHENRYLMRNTDAYYIEKADAYLFEPCRSRSSRGCRPKPYDY